MKDSKLGIGLMSGTSLDGLDIVLVEFSWEKNQLKNTVSFDILYNETIKYEGKLAENLKRAFYMKGEEIALLNHDLGVYFGNQVNLFIEKTRKNGMNREVDFIASHGHTVFHKPEFGYTVQIGNGPEIASVTGIKTITDFRLQDVVLGGQGAPLVPIGDRYLFGQYGACLNLGGFANISFDDKGVRKAFDISPANFLLNHYAKKEEMDYDPDGEYASKGVVNEALVRSLENFEFYSKSAPKTLGQEHIEQFYIPMIENYGLSFEDKMASILEHCTDQIAKEVNLLKTNVLVSGGGVYNAFFMSTLQSKISGSQLVLAEPELIEFKEALIFAFLGLLKIEGKTNVLASVTGASYDHSSGIIRELSKKLV